MNDHMTLGVLGWDGAFAEAFESHEEQGLTPARVLAQHRGSYTVGGAHGESKALLRGRVGDAALLAGGLPAVGDWVAIRHQATGPATIEAVLPRRTSVTRKTAWQEADEQVLVANVDTLFVVSDLDRDLSARRLERYVAVAYESGAQPVVVLTKLDLCRDPRLILEAEAVSIGLAVVALSNVTGEGLERLEPFLRPGWTVGLIGSSGVGKSTLVNRLAGAELVPTGAVRCDGRGRHTTRHRQLIVLPDGALLVDTPGLRELQLWDGNLDEAFADLTALAAHCRFSDCAHVSEPDCAVLAAIASGRLDANRLASYRKLERELEAVAARSSRRVWAARKRRWRQRARESRRARRYGDAP